MHTEARRDKGRAPCVRRSRDRDARTRLSKLGAAFAFDMRPTDELAAMREVRAAIVKHVPDDVDPQLTLRRA